jgi:hypothetical protein
MERLTGQALLDKIASLDGMTKAELAIACGYVGTPRIEGNEPRAQVSAFQDALLAAKGVELPIAKAKPGRELSYVLRRQKNGVIVLGGAYLSQLPVHEDQAFQVGLNYKTGEVILTPVEEVTLTPVAE